MRSISAEFRVIFLVVNIAYRRSPAPRRRHAGAAHGLLPKAASSAVFAFWRQLTSRFRYNHASIAKVSLLLTSTTCAVVATRADTCRTSNSIMSSLSAIFIAPVTSISFFMALLLLHYGILVAYIWMRAILRVFTCGRDDFSDGGRKHGERSPAVEGGTRTISRHAAACEGRFRCRRISAAAAVPLSAARQPRWQAIQEHWLQHCYRSFAAGRGTPMAAPAADTMG